MKKITVILLSMLLVLVVGQAAFANTKVGLAAGYCTFDYFDGVFVDLSGTYRFNNWFSLAGDAFAAFGKYTDDELLKGFTVDGHIFAKFDLYSYGYFSIGAQVGVKNNFYRGEDTIWSSSEGKDIKVTDSINKLSAGVGVFIDLYVAPKAKISFDLLVPVFYVVTIEGITETMFGVAGVDFKFGVNYEITPKFDVGVELGIKAADLFVFSIGAKVGYSF